MISPQYKWCARAALLLAAALCAERPATHAQDRGANGAPRTAWNAMYNEDSALCRQLIAKQGSAPSKEQLLARAEGRLKWIREVRAAGDPQTFIMLTALAQQTLCTLQRSDLGASAAAVGLKQEQEQIQRASHQAAHEAAAPQLQAIAAQAREQQRRLPELTRQYVAA
jgi:hypothetical protein